MRGKIGCAARAHTQNSSRPQDHGPTTWIALRLRVLHTHRSDGKGVTSPRVPKKPSQMKVVKVDKCSNVYCHSSGCGLYLRHTPICQIGGFVVESAPPLPAAPSSGELAGLDDPALHHRDKALAPFQKRDVCHRVA